MFNGTFGTWKTDPVDFELKKGVKLICSKPYPVPKIHEEMFKKEVESLVLLGEIEISNNSEWGVLSFALPKPKSNRVRFLSDFRNLNKPLKREPYPMPKINKILLRLEGFQCATSLYLNMVYCHI